MGTAVTGELIPLLDPNGSAQYVVGRNNSRDIRVGLIGSMFMVGTDGFTPRQGILIQTATGNDLQVLGQATPNGSVIVKKGKAIIPRTGQGAYLFVNETDLTVTMPAASAVNPRIDIVCCAAYDKGNFGADAFHGPQIEVVQGVVQASPPVPPTPAGMFKLAEVFRAVNDNTISTEITDKRTTTVTTGGIRVQAPGDATDANVGAQLGEIKDDGAQLYRWNGTAHTPLYEYLNRAPRCVLRRVAVQSVAAGDSTVSWDTADANIGGMWTAGSPTLITIQKTGQYLVTFAPYFDPTSTVGSRNAHLALNGTSGAQFIEGDARTANVANGEAKQPKISQSFVFTAGDVLRGMVYQDSGGAINLATPVLGATTQIYNRMTVSYQGPSV